MFEKRRKSIIQHCERSKLRLHFECTKGNKNVKMAFSSIFVLLKVACLVTLFDRKLQVFKNSPKCTIFGIFN